MEGVGRPRLVELCGPVPPKSLRQLDEEEPMVRASRAMAPGDPQACAPTELAGHVTREAEAGSPGGATGGITA